MNEKELGIEYQVAYDSAIKQINESQTNFHLVISPEQKAEDVAESLRQKKISELLHFKGPGILGKISGKPVEASGTPVILINNSDAESPKLRLSMLNKLIDMENLLGSARPSIDKKIKQRIEEITAVNNPSDSECNDLLEQILAKKHLKNILIVVNTQNIDKSDNMAEVTTTTGVKERILPGNQRSRAMIGENLKTLRAATGAQIVIVSQKDTSFASESGNNGMQLGHDITKINLLKK